MIIIGELINSTRKEVSNALRERDSRIIKRLARTQYKAGADIIDINAATSMEKEAEDTQWLVEVVQSEIEGVRLSIDTPNPEAMEEGLKLCRDKPLINSITNEPRKREKILSLVKRFDAEVIALTMGEGGIPKTVKERVQQAQQIVNYLTNNGVNKDRIFIDPLVMSISTNQDQGLNLIKALSTIRERFEVKTSVGISNVSFGLPNRPLLNRSLLAILMGYGLDAAIVNPNDDQLMETMKACEALLGDDKNCLNYIQHMRGK